MRRTQDPEAMLITSAPESGDLEYDRRRRKYAIMMSIRALCVIAAACTYRVSIYLALALGVLLGAELNAAIEQLKPSKVRPPRVLDPRSWQRFAPDHLPGRFAVGGSRDTNGTGTPNGSALPASPEVTPVRSEGRTARTRAQSERKLS